MELITILTFPPAVLKKISYFLMMFLVSISLSPRDYVHNEDLDLHPLPFALRIFTLDKSKNIIGRTVVQMSAQLYLDQGLVDWPLTPSDIYRRLGLMRSAAAFLDMMTAGWKPYRRGESENARDFIISTIPLTRTLQLLGKDKPALTRKIPFRHMLLLYLLVRKPAVTGRQLTYAFSERIPFKRLVEFKHYDDRGIPPEQTGIAAEICYTHKEEIQDKPGIYSRVVENLRQMGLMEEEDIIDHCYRISDYAYPVEALGYEKAREEILEEITFDNMISCGRQGISRYCQMPFAYKMGTAAAAHINDRIFNRDRHLELCYDFAYRKSISGE